MVICKNSNPTRFGSNLYKNMRELFPNRYTICLDTLLKANLVLYDYRELFQVN